MDVFELLRRFRHDLFNDLQILSGHLQLGRPTETLRSDVSTVIERIQEISRIFSCQDNQLAVLLWSWQEQAHEREISISFAIEPLPAPAAASQLELAAAVGADVFEQLNTLADEERWLHVVIDGEAILLRLTCPELVGRDLAQQYGCQVTMDEDGQLELTLALQG